MLIAQLLALATLGADPVTQAAESPPAVMIEQQAASANPHPGVTNEAQPSRPICRVVQPTGTRFRARVCETPEQRAAREEAGRDMINEAARNAPNIGDTP